jgi:predicted ArsR family transcriptional regulator
VDDEKSEISSLIGYCSPQGGFPMRVSDSSVGGGAGQFHATRWTLAMASARDQSQTGRAALAALCQTYWHQLREEIRRTVSDSADVDSEIHQLCEALVAPEGWIMP